MNASYQASLVNRHINRHKAFYWFRTAAKEIRLFLCGLMMGCARKLTNIFRLCTFLRYRGKGHQTTVTSNFYNVPR